LGNECTLAAALNGVHRFVGSAQLLCIASEPSDAGPRHGIDAVSIRVAHRKGRRLPKYIRGLWRAAAELGDFVRVLRVARTLDSLLITGTGILSDAGEGLLGLPFELFKWSLATKLSGGRVCFLSVGVEDLDRRWSRAVVRAALWLADYRSFRDRLSRCRVEKLWPAAAADAVYPDLAFSLPESLLARIDQPRPARRCAGVGVYSYCGRGKGGGDALAKYEAYLSTMCAFIAWLMDHGYQVRILVGDLTYDDDVRGDVRERLVQMGKSLESSQYVDEPASSFQHLLDQLALVDLVVATRFHTVLLALLVGKPAVSISYDAKNDDLMASMGMDAYCQSLQALNLQRLVEQFTALEDDTRRLTPLLRRKAVEYRAALDEQYRIVCGG
jgi:polysaccharide pyruvyl transferase WcaK-like protein